MIQPLKHSDYEDIHLPEETWGSCKVHNCPYVGLLGDKLCPTHWDRQAAGKARPNRGEDDWALFREKYGAKDIEP